MWRHYQANFASHHTRNRPVGFFLAWHGIGKYNKMFCYSLFSLYYNTKLKQRDKNISTHTQWKFWIEVNQKVNISNCKLTHWVYWFYYMWPVTSKQGSCLLPRKMWFSFYLSLLIGSIGSMQFPLDNRENKNSQNVCLSQIRPKYLLTKISTYTVVGTTVTNKIGTFLLFSSERQGIRAWNLKWWLEKYNYSYGTKIAITLKKIQ